MKMKNLLIGMVIGAMAGIVLAEVPAVKNFVQSGKKKLKKMLKSNDD